MTPALWGAQVPRAKLGATANPDSQVAAVPAAQREFPTRESLASTGRRVSPATPDTPARSVRRASKGRWETMDTPASMDRRVSEASSKERAFREIRAIQDTEAIPELLVVLGPMALPDQTV